MKLVTNLYLLRHPIYFFKDFFLPLFARKVSLHDDLLQKTENFIFFKKYDTTDTNLQLFVTFVTLIVLKSSQIKTKYLYSLKNNEKWNYLNNLKYLKIVNYIIYTAILKIQVTHSALKLL